MTKLLHAIIHGHSHEAMFETCQYMRSQNLEEMEETWISAVAMIGKRKMFEHSKTWRVVQEQLWSLLRREEYHIREVLEMTAMLILLHKKLASYPEKVATMAMLRKSIVDHFPEGATLSYKGQEVFRRIIPQHASDVLAFAHRILAGFTKLIHEERWDDMYNALTYLSARNLSLPLPGEWPAPNIKEAQKGNPCWFLWGAMISAMPCYSDVERAWQIFCWQWKPSHRKARLGLLCGMVHFAKQQVDDIPMWTKEDLMVLQKVREVSEQLWQEVNMQEPREPHEVSEPHDEPDILVQYHPRGIRSKPPEDPSTAQHEKTIKFRERRGLQEDGDIKTSKNTKIKKIDEASDTDPRLRWLDYGTEGKGDTRNASQTSPKQSVGEHLFVSEKRVGSMEKRKHMGYSV